MKIHIIFFENKEKTEIQHILEFNLFSNWFSTALEYIRINPYFKIRIWYKSLLTKVKK